MTARLKKLKLKNFLRFTDFEYEFPSGVSLFGIVGRNGSGKTSLVESLSYVLFGANRDSDRLVRNRYIDSKKMEVEAEFLFNDYSLLVKRGINERDNSYGEVWLNTERVVNNYSGVTPYVEKFLGLSKKIFLISSFCKQGDFDNLTKDGVSSAERKNIFSDILGLKVYSLTEERIKNSIKLVEGEMQSFVFMITQMKEEIKNLELNEPAKRKQELEEKKKEIENKLEEVENQRQKLLEEYNKIHELELKDMEARGLKDYVSTLKSNIEENQKEIQDIRKYIEQSQQELLEIKAKHKDLLVIQVSQDLIDKQNQFQNDLGFLEGKLKEIQNQSQKIESLVGTCPTCLQELSKEAKEITLSKLCNECSDLLSKKDPLLRGLEELQVTLKELNNKIEEINLERKEYETTFTLLEKQIFEKTDSLSKKEDSTQKDLEVFGSKVKELEQVSNLVRGFDTTKLQSLKNILTNIEASKEKFNKELQTTIQSLERYTIQEEKLRELGKKINVFDNKLKIEYKKNMDVLVILKKIFSRDGIPTSIMMTVLEEIEEYSNQIIKKVLPNFSIEFRTKIENQKGEVRDGLDIAIYDNGQESGYSLLSGGEQDIINVALNLGIAFLVRSRSKSPFDMIFIDEVFRHLDDINVEKLTELINGLQEHFSQIFVISHKPFVQNIFPVVFNVRREGMFSEVGVEKF